MGEVLKRAYSLNRLVGLKIVREGRHALGDETRRFCAKPKPWRAAPSAYRGADEAGEADGQPFIAMEYVPGGTLAEAFAESTLHPVARRGV